MLLWNSQPRDSFRSWQPIEINRRIKRPLLSKTHFLLFLYLIFYFENLNSAQLRWVGVESPRTVHFPASLKLLTPGRLAPPVPRAQLCGGSRSQPSGGSLHSGGLPLIGQWALSLSAVAQTPRTE